MTASITLSGVTFAPTDFDNYGWLGSVTVNGTAYIRILALFAAGIGEMQANTGAFNWAYSATTTMADPGTGTVRFNNATLGSITGAAVSALTNDTGNPNILTILKTWDDNGSSPNRGQLIVRKSGTPATYVAFTVTGSVTDNTTWVQLALTYIGSSGSLTAADSLSLTFYSAGPAGSDYTANAALNAIAALTPAADRLPYFTGASAAALATFSAFIRTLTSAADAATALATLTALGQGVRSLPVPASSMQPATTNGAAFSAAESATNKIMQLGMDFDQSTEQYAQFSIRMPTSWNLGTITCSFDWIAASASTNSVVWGLQAVALKDNDTFDTALGTVQEVTDANGGTSKFNMSAATAAITVSNTPTSGCAVYFRVRRTAASGSDNLAATATLLQVNINITLNAAVDT